MFNLMYIHTVYYIANLHCLNACIIAKCHLYYNSISSNSLNETIKNEYIMIIIIIIKP